MVPASRMPAAVKTATVPAMMASAKTAIMRMMMMMMMRMIVMVVVVVRRIRSIGISEEWKRAFSTAPSFSRALFSPRQDGNGYN